MYTVPKGGAVTFAVAANDGYVINTVTGCGGTLDAAAGTYTTGPTSRNCTVTATFMVNRPYTVISRAGRHGTISPSGRQRVERWKTASFTVTPDANHVIRNVTGCGGKLNGSMYITKPIPAAAWCGLHSESALRRIR